MLSRYKYCMNSYWFINEQFPKEMWPSLYLVQFESGWRNSPRGVKKLERAAKKFERNEKKYERKMRKNEKKTQ